MSENEMFVYTINEKVSINQENFQDKTYSTIVVLAEGPLDQINEDDISNIQLIASYSKAQTITFDGGSQDLSQMINQKLFLELSDSEHLQGINIFASSDKHCLFNSSFIMSKKNITVEYSMLKLSKFEDKIEITLKNHNQIQVFMELLTFISSIQGYTMTIKVLCVAKIDVKIQVFSQLYQLFKEVKSLNISIPRFIEYKKDLLSLTINQHFINSITEFNSQILQVLPVSSIKINLESKTTKQNVFVILKQIKSLQDSLQKITMQTDAECIYDASLEQIDLKTFNSSFQINFNQQASVSWDHNKSIVSLANLGYNSLFPKFTEYFLGNKRGEHLHLLRLKNCYNSLNYLEGHRLELFSLKEIEVSEENSMKLVFSEKDFKFKLSYFIFDSFIKILNDLYLAKKSEFHRLQIKITEAVSLSYSELTTILQFNLPYFNIKNSIFFTPKELSIQQKLKFQEIQEILEYFPNVEKLTLVGEYIEDHQIPKIIKQLPAAITELSLTISGFFYTAPKIIVNKDALEFKYIDFLVLDHFKNIQLFESISKINIQCYCDQPNIKWVSKIQKLKNLSSLSIRCDHRSHSSFGLVCEQLAHKAIENLSSDLDLLSSVSEFIELNGIRYKKEDFLEMQQEDYKVRSSLISNLEFVNLTTIALNQEEFLGILLLVKERTAKQKPKLNKLKLELQTFYNVDDFEKIMYDLSTCLNMIIITVNKYVLFKIDFSNREFQRSFFKQKNEQEIPIIFQDLSQFKKILYSSTSYPLQELSDQKIQNLLSPINNAQTLLCFKLRQEYGPIMSLLREIQRSKIKSKIVIWINQDLQLDQFHSLHELVSLLVNEDLLQSFTFYGNYDITYHNRNLSFVNKDENRITTVSQSQVFIHLLGLFQKTKSLNVVFRQSWQFDIPEAKELLEVTKHTTLQGIHFQNIYHYNNIVHQNLATAQLSKYFFYKKILLKLLRRFRTVGLDRFEKVDQYLSFINLKPFTYVCKSQFEDQSCLEL